MFKIQQFIFIISIAFSTSSFGSDKPFKAVQDLFSAISEINHEKMKSIVTSDFQLLEVGEDWDINDLIKVVNPSEYIRRNYFSVIKTKSSGNTAWVSYWNKATFTKGEMVEVVVWLESAVPIKDNNNWKIQMLHSTKIKPENLPKNILLSEYKI
ncbi:nuclear transport factor 2 family protein [Colwellia sp. 1_MG-2023]|uniref:nuclear transport factor 2 family protein n=1 Tax=Colwellia sp. 1_MG-2023 TaxID=3062649 RepID=UPI0026E38FD5|nr:nuclear transport factor 2 family protein [Colwellia sp. 1_MG-2023]MDO6446120.1 nuclear transport factor 2 family protein [Colwellia sp. 1_MG-2023]